MNEIILSLANLCYTIICPHLDCIEEIFLADSQSFVKQANVSLIDSVPLDERLKTVADQDRASPHMFHRKTTSMP